MTNSATLRLRFDGRQTIWLLCLITTLLATKSVAQSTGAPPLPMNNRTPFTQVFIGATAPDYTLAPGQHLLSAQFDISSHSLIESSEDVQIEIDGETLRLALSWHYRPFERWIVRAELPVLFHSGGFLDGSIDRWHELTGLPDGERDRQPRNALLFGFRDDRQTVLVDQQQQAIGDIQFSTAFQLQSTDSISGSVDWNYNSWVQLGVKLPTGSARKLSGSEATDVALSIHHNRQQAHSSRPWTLSADAFALITGDSEVILTQNNVQWQVNLRAAKPWNHWIVPEVQLRYRSATYDSPVAALGSDSIGIDVGVTLRHAIGYWKIGISEDIDVDSAPDVGFYVQYNRQTGTP